MTRCTFLAALLFPPQVTSQAELEKTCAAYVAERLAQRRAPLAAAAAPSPDGERPEGGDAGEEEEQEKLELATRKMRVDLVAKMIQGEEESEPPVMLKTWDFGGQREYYVMHHLFLTNRGFYIVVTRLDAWLNGPLDDDAGHLRFGQEECANRLVTDWFVLEVKWRVA
eukprot:g25077.t1